MALKQWSFAETNPAGSRPPAWPGGFHSAIIDRAEDAPLKEGQDPSKARFYVYFAPNPQECPLRGVEGREGFGYDDKSGFTMKLFMDVLGLPLERIKSSAFSFDPTHPTSGLKGKKVYIEVRKGVREWNGQPQDQIVTYANREEWEKAKAEAAAANQPAGATLNTAAAPTGLPTGLPGGIPGVPAAAMPVTPQATVTNGAHLASPGALPGLPGVLPSLG